METKRSNRRVIVVLADVRVAGLLNNMENLIPQVRTIGMRKRAEMVNGIDVIEEALRGEEEDKQ